MKKRPLPSQASQAFGAGPPDQPAEASESAEGGFSVVLCSQLSSVAPAEWDALLGVDDAPLLSWGYLQSLEESGCVGGATRWHPLHILVRRLPPGSRDPESVNAGELVAAAPAYLKGDSDGEWVYDGEWAQHAQDLRVDYYPKLVLALPFNPVTGSRLLTRPTLPDAERQLLRGLLLDAVRSLCEQAKLSSAHALFPRDEELPALSESGFWPRQQEQYHFQNRGYGCFDDFLRDLRGHRRNTIRRERAALRAAGITVTTCRGLGPSPFNFSLAELDQVFDMYVNTSQRYTGEDPYLNRRFFHLCAERLGDRLELVLARGPGPGGKLLAGAFNLRGDRRLFGRHWGEAVHVPFLHFEVCFYHSMERCITEGYAAFEPGHGGEQKLLRGFTPVLTNSAHYVREPRLRRPVAVYIQVEAPYVAESLRAATERCPLRPQQPAADLTKPKADLTKPKEDARGNTQDDDPDDD